MRRTYRRTAQGGMGVKVENINDRNSKKNLPFYKNVRFESQILKGLFFIQNILFEFEVSWFIRSSSKPGVSVSESSLISLD